MGDFMQGKLIVIEGTNSSGKQTQADMLVNRLNQNGFNSERKIMKAQQERLLESAF